jgi:hypothetical protein
MIPTKKRIAKKINKEIKPTLAKKIKTLLQIMVYFIIKLDQNLVILTFGQFDHLVILNKLI